MSSGKPNIGEETFWLLSITIYRLVIVTHFGIYSVLITNIMGKPGIKRKECCLISLHMPILSFRMFIPTPIFNDGHKKIIYIKKVKS